MDIRQLIETTEKKVRTLIILAKEYYAKARDFYFKSVDFLKSRDSDPYWAASGYFPFIGWVLPLYLREESDLCQKCGKQGLLLSAYAAAFLLGMFFIELFIPRSIKIVSFSLIVLTYIFNIGYMALAASGMYQAVYGKIIRIPVISDKTDKIVL